MQIAEHIDNNAIVEPIAEKFQAEKKRLRRDNKLERTASRIWEIDFIRGVCVILMLFDHFMYDIMDIFAPEWFAATGNEAFLDLQSFAAEYWVSTLRTVVHPIVLMCFFVICGLSSSFSRNNFKRGIIALLLAFAITGVTVLMDMPILFGVLHMLAVSILLMAFIRLISRKRPYMTAIISLVLGVAIIIGGYVFQSIDVKADNYLAFISEAFVDSGFNSFDYFPIFPNTGFVLIGAALAPFLYPKKRTLFPSLDTALRWYRPVNFFGRHALVVYALHQIVWFVLLLIATVFIMPNGFEAIGDILSSIFG